MVGYSASSDLTVIERNGKKQVADDADVVVNAFRIGTVNSISKGTPVKPCGVKIK
jgi:hypothetical protein